MYSSIAIDKWPFDNVSFAPDSGLESARSAFRYVPLPAKVHRIKTPDYSITSSAEMRRERAQPLD
jgi:hypothetical protein